MVLTAFILPVQASDANKITGYANDYAAILDEKTEQHIEEYSKKIEDKTQAQIVVLTVKSLEGKPIEDYANEKFREARLGNSEKNNGILLVVAKDEKEMRIEVGYGLEEPLPDSVCGRIRDQNIVPFFEQGKYSQGVESGYDAIAGKVSAFYNLDFAKDFNGQESKQNSDISWQMILIIIVCIIILSIVIGFLGGDPFFLIWLILNIISGVLGGSDDGDFFGGDGGSSGGGGASGDW